MRNFGMHLNEAGTTRKKPVKKGSERLHELLSLPTPSHFMRAMRNAAGGNLTEDEDLSEHLKGMSLWYRYFEKLDASSKGKIVNTMLLMTTASCPSRKPWVYGTQSVDGYIYRGKMLTRGDVLTNLVLDGRMLTVGSSDFYTGRISYAPAHPIQSWTVNMSIAQIFSRKGYGADQILSCVLRQRLDPSRIVIGTQLSNLITEMFGVRTEDEVVYLDGKERVEVLIPTSIFAAGVYQGVPFRDLADVKRRLILRVGEKNAEAIFRNKAALQEFLLWVRIGE
jgi:hypothetical protein